MMTMMKMNDNVENGSRRRMFLKSGLRAIVLGAIACAGGLLGWRELHSDEDGTVCRITSPCQSCGKLTVCTDPKALESVQNLPSNQQE